MKRILAATALLAVSQTAAPEAILINRTMTYESVPHTQFSTDLYEVNIELNQLMLRHEPANWNQEWRVPAAIMPVIDYNTSTGLYTFQGVAQIERVPFYTWQNSLYIQATAWGQFRFVGGEFRVCRFELSGFGFDSYKTLKRFDISSIGWDDYDAKGTCMPDNKFARVRLVFDFPDFE